MPLFPYSAAYHAAGSGPARCTALLPGNLLPTMEYELGLLNSKLASDNDMDADTQAQVKQLLDEADQLMGVSEGGKQKTDTTAIYDSQYDVMIKCVGIMDRATALLSTQHSSSANLKKETSVLDCAQESAGEIKPAVNTNNGSSCTDSCMSFACLHLT
jgi:hypothetical protein